MLVVFPNLRVFLYQNVPIELEGKMVLIDIEVVDAPLNYNILLGRSYMYAMKAAVFSLVSCTMIFPHAGGRKNEMRMRCLAN